MDGSARVRRAQNAGSGDRSLTRAANAPTLGGAGSRPRSERDNFMRDFFINSFEKLIAVIVVVTAAASVIGGLVTMFSEGFFAGILVLIIGAIYTVVLGGGMYLAFGIYHNTKRTADAVERMAAN